MSKSVELKDIRKQVRQIAKELLPELMQQELYAMVEKNLMQVIVKRLNEIDERQKDISSFMVRSLNNPIVK